MEKFDELYGSEKVMGEEIRGTAFYLTNVKNRYKHDAGGMRDLLMNIRIVPPASIDKCRQGHITELQVHHVAMTAAKGMFHCVYAYLRRIDEALATNVDTGEIFCEKCNYRLDTNHNKRKGSALAQLTYKWLIGDTR